jgi:hypothetical protein
MSAIPKKKLCWNCEGNVAKDIDNCPYCGVYLHANVEEEEDHSWNPPYQLTALKKDDSEEEHPPYYPAQEEKTIKADSPSPPSIGQQLKKDILPIFLLLAGSSFFLFGFYFFSLKVELLPFSGTAVSLFIFFFLAFPLFSGVGATCKMRMKNNSPDKNDYLSTIS